MDTCPPERSIEVKNRDARRMQNALQAALKLNRLMHTAGETEIVQLCLEECEALTESQIGFFHFVNPDQQTIHLKTWSVNTRSQCVVPGFQTHYPVAQAGVWVDCLHQRQPVIHNEYASLPHRKGLPAGHVAMVREMVVPIFDHERIVAIIGVGNKATDYDQTDIDQVQLLAENIWFAIQRKRDTHQRDALLEELNAVNSELQSIVFAASHDLRTPLVNIDGFSREMEHSYMQLQRIISDKRVPAEVRRQFNEILYDDLRTSMEYIHTSTHKMHTLIDALLRISRVGSDTIAPRRLNMNELLEAAVDTVQYRLLQLAGEVKIDALPDCVADHDQVNQVFTNLLDNAIKYRQANRPLQIRIGGRIDGEMSRYTVTDNGQGIDETQRDKIFELFYRINPQDNSAQGEGLGLTLIHRILGRNGGRIHVDSQVGVGTTFTVALPTSR